MNLYIIYDWRGNPFKTYDNFGDAIAEAKMQRSYGYGAVIVWYKIAKIESDGIPNLIYQGKTRLGSTTYSFYL